MHLHMVAMSVAAVSLIAEQQFCVFFPKYVGESPRRVIEIGSAKPDPSRWIRVEIGTVATIRVAKALDPVDSENARAGAQFIQPRIIFCVMHAPVGRGDDDNAMPGGSRPRECATGEDYLVVRMGVECHDGSHATQYAR